LLICLFVCLFGCLFVRLVGCLVVYVTQTIERAQSEGVIEALLELDLSNTQLSTSDHIMAVSSSECCLKISNIQIIIDLSLIIDSYECVVEFSQLRRTSTAQRVDISANLVGDHTAMHWNTDSDS
jgi:hypothetical protein